MPDDFDPYYVWLGIGAEEQPANHYRLLGIRPFEPNADVIDNAADRQTAHLRTLQSGQQGKHTQRLLNEVAAARLCLLKPESKAAYDQKLRAMMTAGAAVNGGSAIGRIANQPQSGSAIGRGDRAAPPQSPQTPANSAIGRRAAAPLQVAQALSTAPPQRTPNPKTNFDSLMSDDERAAGRKTKPDKLTVGKQTRRAWIVAAVVALFAAAGLAFVVMRGPSEGVLTFDWPAADRAGATLMIDGQPQNIPDSGSWEFRGPVGAHQIVAQRPSLKYEATMTLAKGEPQPVVPQWRPKAELIVNWPLAERSGAALTIDGHAHAIAQQEPLKLAIEPGRHVMRIARPNAEPFEQTITIAPDEVHSVTIVRPAPTLLVLDWPAAERSDGQLWIDDQPQAVDLEASMLEFHLKPGAHSIMLARGGFQPIEQRVTLKAGKTTPLTPAWTAAVSEYRTGNEQTASWQSDRRRRGESHACGDRSAAGPPGGCQEAARAKRRGSSRLAKINSRRVPQRLREKVTDRPD